MPIYEFSCKNCEKVFSVLMKFSDDQTKIRCPACKGLEIKRLLSRFAAPRSEEARIERMADPSKWGGFDENDPKSMVKFMKKMGKEFGDDLGEDFDQVLEEAGEEAAQSREDGGKDDLYSPEDL